MNNVIANLLHHQKESPKILSQIDINPKIKEGILIDSVLMEINSVNNAKRVVIPNIGFYNENTGMITCLAWRMLGLSQINLSVV
jgi:hypothetical protein